jgi:hypothetical protein
MVFNLEITLGNEAMSTAEHLATALESAAKRVRLYDVDDSYRKSLQDENGNRVGFFELTEEED